jgi:hypothetical protein
MPRNSNDPASIVVWCLIAVAAILIGFTLVVWVRKRLHEPDEPASAGFSLSDLRQLHREGKISTEEYERAKARMTASLMREQKPKKPS